MQRLLLREISNFHVNPIVKAYIITDTILWSSWNLFTPIFAVFVVTKIQGGNIEAAASCYSAYLITRVIFELVSARYLMHATEKRKFHVSIAGMLVLSIAYIGFAFSSTVSDILFFYIISGFGIGVATPAKCAIFATHLDKHRETTEWGITDAAAFLSIAVATTIGGLIVKFYGFSVLFLVASILNLLGTVPFIRFLPLGKRYIFTSPRE